MDTWKVLDDFIAFALRRPIRNGGANYRWRTSKPSSLASTDFTPAVGERMLAFAARVRPSHNSFISHYLNRSACGPDIHSSTVKEYASLLFPNEEGLVDFTKLCCLFAFLADLAVECAKRKECRAFEVISDNALHFITVHMHDRLKEQGGLSEFLAYCKGTSNRYRSSDFVDLSEIKEIVDRALAQKKAGIAQALP